MADGLRSRDTLGNSGKCYTMFFDTEILEKRKPNISPKKRQSSRKRVLILEPYSAAKILKVGEENPKHVHFKKSESIESDEEHGKRKLSSQESDVELKQEVDAKKPKINIEKDQMFEIFQSWALKTYGDQAKTKTITLKKKARILKALDGKEQNNPDSSKFRFWVKSKGFTIRIPENFANHELNQETNTQRDEVDLYVASTTKDFGERTYKKVAVVEEFFHIIYNIHVEQGGLNCRHAGQKRTYRIITETYAFLPREAVTKFLSGCPACKKNLRPFSPTRFDEQFTESSSEFEALNYSSQNESSADSSQHEMAKSLDKTKPTYTKFQDLILHSNTSNQDMPNFSNKIGSNTEECEITKVKCKTGEIRKGDDFKFHNYWNISRPNVSNEHILNYYQFLKKFYSHSSINPLAFPIDDSNLNNKVQNKDFQKFNQANSRTSNVPAIAFDESPPTIRSSCSNSTIDLTIKPSDSLNQRININIENPLLSDYNLSTKCNASISPSTTPNLFINSVDVSINVSKNVNQLKISCKTTPPKKRHNVYNKNAAAEKVDSNCAIDLSTIFCETKVECDIKQETKAENGTRKDPESFKLDLNTVKPITSTYLKMTRSLGLSDEEALKIDDLESLPTSGNETISDQATEDSYAGLMKDADKLKLMLLAWNYQNSSAARNSTDAPDLGVVGGLWAQYQNALALNTKQSSVSPVHRAEQSSPIENQDETNSSGQKDEDDGSEDDSDDKLDQNAQDPERLKAFNMFVRLFVDENLDRMIPISKQPKEKIQAIIDSCARQFPEFCERSRKRIRTYLKSCRRNKKAREGWDNTSRPTPAHLTSVQAEQILAIACENESMNAKRMRVGLDPISQAMPLPSGVPNPIETIAPSIPYPTFRTTPNTTSSSTEPDQATPATTVQSVNPARSSPLSLNTTGNEAKALTVASNITTNSQISNSPLYRPADFASPSSTSSPYAPRPQTYPTFFPTSTSTIAATPTDLSMKQHQPQSTQQLPSSGVSPTPRPPIVTHKLSANEITAARQVITAYRESAAFLLRTADQVEQLLLQQQ